MKKKQKLKDEYNIRVKKRFINIENGEKKWQKKNLREPNHMSM